MTCDIAHYRGLTYWGPFRAERIESILDLVELKSCSRALDIGCGRGEVLLRLVERAGVSAVGVDRSAAAIALLQAEVARRVPGADVRGAVGDAAEFASGSVHGEDAYDFVSWLGGPYIGESAADTVRVMASWLRPGGYLFVGHGFWQQPPSDAYLEATGITVGEFDDHWANIVLGRDAGLVLHYTCVSDRGEWDHFEGSILSNWEKRLSLCPDDEVLRRTVERKRRWNDAQQRWGRDTMGFGLYLFRRPLDGG